MNTVFRRLAAVVLVSMAINASATLRYVDINGENPTSPYLDWSTAATNIQDAVDASVNGDTVMVTNGVYATGGYSMDGVITNRVSINKAITVQSVNGPAVTFIQGAWDPVSTNGPAAVRCVWITNNAVLRGFTLRGGATRAVNLPPAQSMNGGGVCASSTGALVSNCLITNNFASYYGGGAYQATLTNCTVSRNHSDWAGPVGAGMGDSGSGGGAAYCNLRNSLIVSNTAHQLIGGGTIGGVSINCQYTGNRAYLEGSAAAQGILINCTVSTNLSGGCGSHSGAVFSCQLTNCIVYANQTASPGTHTNYYLGTFSYCDTDPLPSGTGNIDLDPQFLSDAVHLANTSPCLGVGSTAAVYGTDIDGQPWNNPPSMGCDEWHPDPVIAFGPSCSVDAIHRELTLLVSPAGQSPFGFYWYKDSSLIHEDAHYTGSGSANLVVNRFGPEDTGLYQVVISNASGVVTSQVAQVTIHAVNANGSNPVAPFASWTTAATNIQDAIDIALPGEVVLVTNGIYATGGKFDGFLTNRVMIDKPVTVLSVNGYAATMIQGQWDPISTNGSAAVRCASLTDGSRLIGFTLRNGATLSPGNLSGTGGGAWCTSTNALLSNCLLTKNCGFSGGGIAFGSLLNSAVVDNMAVTYGGGAYYANLTNCTVCNNFAANVGPHSGGGTFEGVTANSIVFGNYNLSTPGNNSDNYSASIFYLLVRYVYSCSSPLAYGSGNISTDPLLLDGIHISASSPCRGAGSPLYAVGNDIDGESWETPPSMGCDEVVPANILGPISTSVIATFTNLPVNNPDWLWGSVTGRVAYYSWDFNEGTVFTNLSLNTIHFWTNPGDYPAVLTAYNADNPAGVSASVLIHVAPRILPQLQSSSLTSTGFQFQFNAQLNGTYLVQYNTNLNATNSWKTLRAVWPAPDGFQSILDSGALSNDTRYYRVLAN